APRARQAAGRGSSGRPPRAPVRRGADGAPRPAGARLVEGGRRASPAARPARLARDPELRAGGRAASAATLTFAGLSVLVTGGSRGIGREIALRFADLGAARVAIGYLRSDRAAEATAAELRERGAEPVLVRGNVASARVAAEVAALGPLDVLVHNAATGVIRPALETEDKHFDWTMSANARAFLSLVRAAAPQIRGDGSIVAVSSLGSTRVLENYGLVGASKAALEALVRYLAVELAPRGVRVNAVSAGLVETDALDIFPNREQLVERSL